MSITSSSCSQLLFVFLVVFFNALESNAFCFGKTKPTSIGLAPRRRTETAEGTFSVPTTTTLFLNNFFSGITNIAPSKPILDGNKALGKDLYTGTYLEQAWDSGSIVCAYKASRDGWSAVNFHRCVDGKGSGLVVAISRGTGAVFGGYNPSGWRSTDDYYNSNAAFLWHCKGNTAIKSPILPGGNAAVYDYATSGPCFGSSDLIIGESKAAVMGGFAGPDMENVAINAGNLRNGNSQFGGTYNKDDGWPVRGKFSLVDIEVYCRK